MSVSFTALSVISSGYMRYNAIFFFLSFVFFDEREGKGEWEREMQEVHQNVNSDCSWEMELNFVLCFVVLSTKNMYYVYNVKKL